MASDSLPPSVNWYSSRASDISKDGILAYASRNAIVLLNVSQEGQYLNGYLHGHEQRVVSVAFNKIEGHLLATCGDDRRVKLWNAKAKTFIKEHVYHEGKVTSLDWSPVSKDVLVSGDDKGNIVLWNQSDGESRQWLPEKDGVTSLACAYSSDINVAVGYNSGQILILELGHKKDIILHRLRGHDDEVQSICWSPLPRQPSENADSGHAGHHVGERHALLSGGKDQTIRLWYPSEEKMTVLKIPAQTGRKSKHRGDDSAAKGRVWVTVWWPDNQPKQFLSSSYGGDIVLWNLDRTGKQKWTVLGQDSSEVHSRPVFSILPVDTSHFLTTSMDRQIILWDLERGTSCWRIPTLGGFVYQLRISPQDDATIAVGVGDNMIRIWSTNTRGSTSRVTSLWQGLKSKVTAICWHPDREGALAFGTDDGRVGLFVAINPNKTPVLSGTFHKKTVYSLSFGPQCCKTNELKAEDGGNVCLFSCGGEGVIYQHHATSMSEEAVSIDVIIRDTNKIQYMLPLRSEVSWRADRKVVAIGNDDGSIEVFAAPHLLMLCTIQVHHKIINCLEWFPVQHDQGQRSNLEFCLASGSNETVVFVHDLSAVLGGDSYCPSPVPISTAFRTLTGHMYRITSLQWNPHADGRLVSVSYDGTAQIWDVKAGEGVANFRGHHGRLLCVAWSHLNPDVLFTGGEDFCLMKWKISECRHSHPPKDKKEMNVKFYNINQGNRDGKKKRKSNKTSVFSKSGSNPFQASAEASLNVRVEKREEQNTNDVTSVKVPEKDLISITELLEKKKQELMQTEDSKEPAKDDGNGIKDEEALEADDAIVREEGEKIKSEGVKEDSTTATEGVREDSTTAPESVEDATRNVSKGKRKKGKSLFPISSRLDNRGKQFYVTDCLEIARRKYGGSNTGPSQEAISPLQEDSMHLGLFCSRKDTFQTMSSEGDYHQDHGNHDFKMWLDLWQGRVLQTIREATLRSQLTDKLVAMAPQAGYEVWLETCQAYAQQLEGSGDAQKAASYYLCCHQVYDAIRTLKDHRHFREAISLATARLPRRDPVLLDVYQCWASQLESEHCFEQAARCYLAIEEPGNAIRLLARSGSQSSLRVALEIALLTNQKDILPSLVPRYANECMLNQDWSEAWEVSSGEVSVMALHLVVLIHEALNLSRNNLRCTDYSDPLKESSYSLNSLEIGVEGYDEFTGWTCPSLRGKPLLSEIFSIWEERDSNYMGQVSKRDVLQAVTKLFLPNFDAKVPTQFLISIAVCLALHLLEEATKETSQGSHKHIERIFQECVQQGDINLMIATLSLVFPSGCFKDRLSSTDNSATPEAGLVEAYYAYAALYHMWWNYPSGHQSQTCALRTSTDHKVQTEQSRVVDTSVSEAQKTRDLPQAVTFNETDVTSSMLSVEGESTLHEKDSREWCRLALRELEICKEVLISTDGLRWYQVRAELECIEQRKKGWQQSSNNSHRIVSDTVTVTDAGEDGSKGQVVDGPVELNDLSGNGGKLESAGNGCVIKSHDTQNKTEFSEVANERTVGEAGDCIQSYQELNNGLAARKDDSLICKGAEGSWEKLPVFERYFHLSVTMEMVLEAEIRIREEWKHLNMGPVYPDPVEAALVITSILTDIILSGYEEPVCWSMLQSLLEWGLDHSYSKKQQKHFLHVMEKVKHLEK